MPRLSVVVTVCNEAPLLKDCLESVKWADDIIIVDMYSTDGSEQIYRRYTDRVSYHSREIVADLSHNFGFAQARGDWLLKLDPDERVSSSLAHQIQDIMTHETNYVAFRLPFKNFIFGKWIQYSGWQGSHQVGLIRLFRREKVTWQPVVHSTPIMDGPVGSIRYDEKLDNAVYHLNYADLTQFLEKFNRYTTAEAQRLNHLKRPFHWLKLFYQPSREFWKRYFRSQGYLDGMHGLILSLLQTFYIMVSYMKLWELERQQSARNEESEN